MRKILIGIQCRTNSTRLPGKCFLKIGDKMIIEHVIDECLLASKFINKLPLYQALCKVRLLIPRGDDELIEKTKHKVDFIEGPEDDVLARYVKAANTINATHIVRVTGDCLYLPSYTISRLLKLALRRGGDYTSNVLMRMQPEGYDCEVISRDLIDWLDENCDEPHDREHVTTKVDELKKERWFNRRFSIYSSKESIDFSRLKTSIDTQEDYDRAVRDWELRQEKIEGAMEYGKVF
jgi:spore coat polysaccharide biosynthesis protein SpsF